MFIEKEDLSDLKLDYKKSSKKLFNIDKDFDVPFFSKKTSLVPEIDPNYVFDKQTTLSILIGLINNKKVCGILQETIFMQNRKYLIVGIGINVSSSPKINNYQTTFLNNYTNKKLKRLELFKEIKLMYEKNLHSFGV